MSHAPAQYAQHTNNWATAMFIPCAAALLFVGTVVDYLTHPAPIAAVSIPKAPISLAVDITRGNTTARVAILEFSDFQCPSCGQFARTVLPSLEAAYVDTGAVLIAFRNMPMSRIHPFAAGAAAAATCAGSHGKFWSVHDSLFNNQDRLDSRSLRALLGATGMSADDITRCVGQPARLKLERDLATARALGVTGTPTFFIGTLSGGMLHVTARLTGFQPASVFAGVLDPLVGDSTPEHK